MKRTLSRLALGVIAAGALLAVACGGGGGGIGGSGGSSLTGADFNKDPVTYVRAYYYTAFRVFAGSATAEDMMRLFEESCRNKVAVADVAKGLEKNRDDYPKLKGAKIEDIDFQGKAKVEKTSNGAKVTVPSAKDSRVKVDGKYQNAFEYFKSVGLADDDDGDDTDEVELILVNGRYFDADCDNLTDIADEGRRANATPTPARATATPARTTPTPARGTTATPARGATTPAATTRAGSGLSDRDVETYTKTYFVMLLGIFSGQSKAADVLNFYTSDCRSKVTTANVTTGLNKLATLYPKMKGDKVEDFDFGGKLKITSSGDKYNLVVPGSKDIRVKINGQFVNLHTYALNVGIEDPGDDGTDTDDQSFVLQGGKLYDADCVFLTDIASTR